MPIIPPRVVGLIQMARGLHVHNTAGASDPGSKKKMSVYTHAVYSKEYGAILWLVLEYKKGMPPSPVL